VPGNYLANQTPGDNMLGVVAMERALSKIAQPSLDQQREYGLVRCCYHQMLSLRLTARFYVEREFMLRSDRIEERRAILRRLQGYVWQEIENAEACLPFVEADSRLGWHSEVFDYQFTPEAIRERVANLRVMAEKTIPAWLATDGGLIAPQPYEEEMSAEPFRVIKEKLGEVDLVEGIFPE